MEEETNIEEIMTTAPPGAVKERYYQQTDEERARRQEIARKARNAAKARERTARFRALGLNARGKPKGSRGSRDPAMQRVYQANFAARHKAAREALGLTIAEFQKLPRDKRMAAMKQPKGVPVLVMSKRKKRGVVVRDNGIVAPDDRSVKFCPHCGWNIDATRKAQAFVDGRVA